jgi:uncharacterized RDD family membrane protein YckC
MERTLDVPTAEAVALHYELAGIGSRFLALVVDLVVQGIVLTAIAIGLAIAGLPLVGIATRVGFRDTASALVSAAFIVGSFVLFFGYFIIFELTGNGRTPGKRALGLRVIRAGGFPVDVNASIIRNLVRILEAGLGFYAISGIVALRSPRNQRIGDYAAGTVVVWDRVVRADILDVLGATTVERDDGLDAADRALIERFFQRRDELDVNARVIVAARIAARMRPKLTASFAHLDDESLLEHLGRP